LGLGLLRVLVLLGLCRERLKLLQALTETRGLLVRLVDLRSRACAVERLLRGLAGARLGRAATTGEGVVTGLGAGAGVLAGLLCRVVHGAGVGAGLLDLVGHGLGTLLGLGHGDLPLQAGRLRDRKSVV